jgi:4-amino-4-deoxy-L-arabinose transferase-like glycosyltransferase
MTTHPAAAPSADVAAARPLPWPLDLALLLIAGLAVNALAARFITHPGYVDAYYYFGGALQLARGHGFTEPYQWNYLAAGLSPTPPWPSHLYWMPLTSLVAAPPMAVAESVAGQALPHAALFRAAQWPFIALGAALPVLSYAVAWSLSRQRRHALAAATLTLFSPFYFVYWSNTDAFALHALVAAAALLAAALAGRPASVPGRPGWALAAGLAAGLAHLARADGLLVLLVVLAWLAWPRPGPRLPLLALVVAGYLLVMAPWFARNVLVVGRPLAGGTQTLWLRDYNELFNYPAGGLTLARYLAAGWPDILAGKWAALRDNTTSLAVVQGGVLAFPFALVGLWRCRRVPLVQLGVLYGFGLLVLMTLAFSFPGPRGGYFHSGAALLPWLMAAAPLGLDAAVEAAARRLPHWQPQKSKPVFTALLVIGSVVLAAVVFVTRVVGPPASSPAWERQDSVYAQAAAWLAAEPVGDDLAVVNNPPGWYYWTSRPAIVIPNGDVPVLLRLMDDYNARWLLLDHNYPAGLAALYAQPESEPRLRLRARLGTAGEPPAYLLELEAAP